MKIIQLYYDSELYDIYVGNEFSPDPLDMQQRIQEAFKNHCTKDTFSRELIVDSGYDNDKNLDKSIKTIEHVRNLLTRNGYVIYNPHIVTIK